MSEITELLGQAREGDASAWDRVVHLLYADLKRLARSISPAGSHQDVTALAHDCYLRLCRSGTDAEAIANRAHFLSLAAMAMRQLVINHARDRVAQKRGGGQWHTTLGKADQQVLESTYAEAEELLEIDHALERLAEKDVRMVRVVECRLFAGYSDEETATALDVSLRTAQRLWQDARGHLRDPHDSVDA